MTFEIDAVVEEAIKVAVEEVDEAAAKDERKIVIYDLCAPMHLEVGVRVEENKANQYGIFSKAGDVFEVCSDICEIVIYAPNPFDAEKEIRATYSNEYDFDDPLFRFSKEYQKLKSPGSKSVI